MKIEGKHGVVEIMDSWWEEIVSHDLEDACLIEDHIRAALDQEVMGGLILPSAERNGEKIFKYYPNN